jgi:hypothetical protein
MCTLREDERNDARTFARMVQQQNAALKEEVRALNDKVLKLQQQQTVPKKESKKKKNKNKKDDDVDALLRLRVKDLELLKRENEQLRKDLDVEKDLRNRAEKELKANRKNFHLALQLAQLQGFCNK